MHSTYSFMNVNVTAVEIGWRGGGGNYMKCLFI